MLNFLLIILGFILLVKGADFLVDGATDIAKKLHIPTIIIGLTIVAVGTSMPELVVSVTSALEGHSDIAIGNIVGSNMANMFLILGICSIIKPLNFKKGTIFIENPLTLFLTTLLFVFCNNGSGNTVNLITLNEGIIFVSICIVFIIYNIVMSKKVNKLEITEEEKSCDKKRIIKSIFYILLGILALKFGGDFVVKSSVSIAKMFGVSEELISLTIVAISTSLPELMTSVVATKKGETDLAIGNIVGSQIFNIVLDIGVSAILCPIAYSKLAYNKYIIVLILGTIMFSLYPFSGQRNKMTKGNGIVFLGIYVLYMYNLIVYR